jgi:hypothetical protein
VDFYNNLLGGSTVAESLRKAKIEFFKYNQNDLSWSSFKIYGNPMKKIELNESYEDLETKVKRWYVRTRSCNPMNCAADLGADINEVMKILSRVYRKK